jgi:hypothetical protein
MTTSGKTPRNVARAGRRSYTKAIGLTQQVAAAG